MRIDDSHSVRVTGATPSTDFADASGARRETPRRLGSIHERGARDRTVEPMLRADAALTRAMRAMPHAAAVDRLLTASSRATDHAAGWIALGAVGAATDSAHRTKWLRGALAAVAAHAAAELIKRVIPRARPNLANLPPLATTPSPHSFPSAHTAAAVAAALGFRGLLPQAALPTVAVVIALSRPYLGVHYPTDVLAGAIVGVAAGRVVGP